MDSNRRFLTHDEILEEIRRLEEGDSDNEEGSDGSVSETEDAVLSDDDYEEIDYVPPAEESDDGGDDIDISAYPNSEDEDQRNFFIGKDQVTLWTDKPLSSIYTRTPSRNILTHLPGPKGRARGLTKEIDIFELFITDEMVQLIVDYTNEEMDRKKLLRSRDYVYQNHTDLTEMKSLIGLLYFLGVLKQSGLTLNDCFHSVYGPSLFRCVMSKNRLVFLLSVLRFDSKTSRAERIKNDKFAAFRQMWTMFEENCRKYYTPSEYVTIDETLLSFRGRCPFRMYLRNKPDKYGMKIISLCDARTFYFCGGIPYIGKTNKKKVTCCNQPITFSHLQSP